MKFVDDVSWKIWELTTETNEYYRTNASGSTWERLYGESWEPVYFKEEEQCVAAWKEYFKVTK